jgi:radical SAM superfamily enzyme YgiQ (UPF0313 family)
MLVYLADLTHTGQVVASNVFPLGIGLIGANILREIPGARVELFKYPSDLDSALQREVPDVAGFANYSWTCNLGMEYAKRIKSRWPHVVIIAGGPNYGSTEEEQHDYWRRFPWVDFYIYKEGEQAAVRLLAVLEQRSWRTQGMRVPGCHRMEEGALVALEPLPRIQSLDELPSPYVSGLMDKFFDGILIPLMHTTRGCPFSCSFCTEGTAYYNRVAKRSTLIEDLTYVGMRHGTIEDLYLSDANVGMFKEDADKARAIAQTQAKYGWPKYIHCSAGKNHKERVLEFAKIVGGGMGVAASLQSTNQKVLDNVKRSNISVEQLSDVARQGSRIDANTYAEIILGLPGDTLEAHTQSLRDCVNSGLSYLRMYQLIMLPETDMNTLETRERFGMKTMWRIMPRCFGRYRFLEEEFSCAEIEEICVSQDSLSFEDYLEARELDLTIEIAHNTNLFRELFGLCGIAGVEWFSLLLAFHLRRRQYLPELFDAFKQQTIAPLWDSRGRALEFAQSHLDLYLTEQLGTNELFNAKAVAFFTLQQELHDCIYAEAQRLMPQYGDYLEQAKDFSLQRKRGLLDLEPRRSQRYEYDFPALLECDFSGDPERHRRIVTIDFFHSPDQRATIEQLVRQYGTSTTGLGRILLRAHIKRLFRQIEANGTVSDKGFETSYRRASNLYGD